jgi:cytochrome c oxidase subunit 2
MAGTFRPRRYLTVALLGALALGLAACGGVYPNSTFSHNTEYNTAIDGLWNRLLFLGTLVFIGVEAALIYVIFKFRRRPNAPQPKPVHGSTTLEIAWTVLPAVILIFVAIPTVRTIFRTQAKAVPDALQVEVIGHQWWWEFRYPQYGFSTANELYLENGRTANFQLKTIDVLHSFWIPQMGGKRDLITNRTNYLWFTPNLDLPSSAWNGACAEFCGSSHANMKFRVYTVTAAEFAGWVKNQQSDVAFSNTPPAALPPAAASVVPAALTPAGKQLAVASKPADSAMATQVPLRAAAWTFPADRIEKEFGYTIPKTPIPAGNAFDETLLGKGDPAKGATSAAICSACHAFSPKIMEKIPSIGPNLTHIGSRHTIGAGLYPNDSRHLALWIKNSGLMKPGSKMATLGKGQINPSTGKPDPLGMFTDAQIADIVAYLQALK